MKTKQPIAISSRCLRLSVGVILWPSLDGKVVILLWDGGWRRPPWWMGHLWRHNILTAPTYTWQNIPAKSSPLSLLFASAWMGGAGLVFNSAIVVPYHGREEDKAASTSWWP